MASGGLIQQTRGQGTRAASHTSAFNGNRLPAGESQEGTLQNQFSPPVVLLHADNLRAERRHQLAVDQCQRLLQPQPRRRLPHIAPRGLQANSRASGLALSMADGGDEGCTVT